MIPVIGIVQVGYQAYEDRYTYFPVIGIFIAIVWTIATIGSMRPSLNIALGAMGFAALGVFGFLSHRQALTWNDTKSMALHATAIDPTNHQASALLAYESFAEHQWNAAERYSEASVRAPDVPATNYLNYGVSLLCLGKFDEAKKYSKRRWHLIFRMTVEVNINSASSPPVMGNWRRPPTSWRKRNERHPIRIKPSRSLSSSRDLADWKRLPDSCFHSDIQL